MTVRGKLSFGFGLLVTMLAILMASNLVLSARTRANLRIVHEVRFPTSAATIRAESALFHALADIRGYLTIGREDLRRNAEAAILDLETEIKTLTALSADWVDPDNLRRLDEVRRDFEQWRALPARIFQLHDDPVSNRPAERILVEEAAPRFDAALGAVNSILEEQDQREIDRQGRELFRTIVEGRASLTAMRAALRGYAVDPEAGYKAEYESALRSNETAWSELSARSSELTAAQNAQLRAVEAERKALLAIAERALQEGAGDRARQDFFLLRTQAAPLDDRIAANLAAVRANQWDSLDEDLRGALAMQGTVRSQALFGGLLAIAVGLISAFFVGRSITGPLSEMANRLAASGAEILAAVSQQAGSAREQSAAVSECVATVGEVARTAEESNERARNVAQMAKKAEEISRNGLRAIEQSKEAMAAAQERGENVAGSIVSLAEQSQAIGEIIATVNEIAERTNLLALNAAIEAARAGEQGKGFAVVAGEVRSLADRSKKSTSKVNQILGEIQKATNSAVMVTEEATKSINATAKSADQVAEAVRSLARTIADANQAAIQISASTGQQTTGMTQIGEAMQNIDQATNQSASATEQTERAVTNLNEIGRRLRELTGAKA
jgi:methyl-accepting chemotaxis protein